ncbi:MAG: aconitate hydratase AcnA [Rhodospirillales bacterium]|nr:aconitate hydratase AcnA [Rhodospirillales bacterium]
MSVSGQDSLKVRRSLDVAGKSYDYFSIPAAMEAGIGDVSRLPFSLKVLLENLLRYEDGRTVSVDDIRALADWATERRSDREIAFRPARVLMQDLTGVPAVVDLAAMRDAMVALGGDPKAINPLSPVDLVIDHSVMVDHSGTPDALKRNMEIEFQRNTERYKFLRWGQDAFDNFRVIPPGAGICHQVNLEFLSQVVWLGGEGNAIAYPDTVVGTDSHTTMVNGMAVLGWGVGGIEAEAAMLGQPISMLIPEVVGFKLTGTPAEGTTATDLVLTVVQMLRGLGVVGKFVEFFGPGLDALSLPDRATIANMGPEYGATCGMFPVDAETIRYLTETARDADRVALVEAYAKAQGMWRDANSPDPVFSDVIELDLGTVEPCISGPKRPQDRIILSEAAATFAKVLPELSGGVSEPREMPVEGENYEVRDGDVVIAAITSCTNTSNPSVLIGAGLLAKKAVEKGLVAKPWVKTSLAPGSQVVEDYLKQAGLLTYLEQLGFNISAFGCTTCIGNSGPLADGITKAVTDGDLVVSSVLSGNRNFEGRVHALVKSNFLASPPLVVAYALAGSLNRDLYNDPLGKDKDGNLIYLKDVWPTNAEIAEAVAKAITPEMYRARYADVFKGPAAWQAIEGSDDVTFGWDISSTYVQNPPYFEGLGDPSREVSPVADVMGARSLAVMADSVTTDHISPAGAIKAEGPAGDYLTGHQVPEREFNSYGSRRGNHQVMMRGTFANIRIRNEMAPGTEGGVTRHMPSGEVMPIFDAAQKYKADGVPLIVIGGKEYGTGSSRDWAAKGPLLLGVKAVIVESFERIHRSNLIGMGVYPLQFKDGTNRKSLNLDGSETFDVLGAADGIQTGMELTLRIHRESGETEDVPVICRIDTLDEIEYFKAGGILQYVLKNLKDAA